MQVVRIFTDKSISPSPSPRQYPNHYAFRAGRNLPDKEFRYLRTVIVTAAVHRGFSRQLRLRWPASLTFRHWAGVSPHTSSCDLAETCVFDKQLLGSCYCNLTNKALLLPKLRSYFAEFLRESYLAPLSILYLPTCVGYGTGIFYLWHCKLFLEVWHRLLQHRSVSNSRLNSKCFRHFSTSWTLKPVTNIRPA